MKQLFFSVVILFFINNLQAQSGMEKPVVYPVAQSILI